MKKLLVGAGCCFLLLFLSQGDALAQNLVPNGGFEQQELGVWTQYGGNSASGVVQYDVTGDGLSWSWKRQPGTNHNGGINQEFVLLGGVDYTISMDLAFLCTC